MELKIAFLIIVASVSNVLANPGYSQVAKVSLNMENKSLEQVMDEIESQSEFYFIFNQKQIDVNRVVDIQVENKLITDILPELFKGTNVNYAVFDRKILLTTDPLKNDLLAITLGTEQQQNRVAGTVTGKDGTPLPGVNVVVTGTTLGAITDIAGKYSITAPQGAKSLTFSFIGMEPKEITIGTLTQINVTMVESAIGLEEVVVVGYGTEKKVNITGSVTIVDINAIHSIPTGSSDKALQGQASGVTVINNGGPGVDSKIFIRGITSFGDTSPLIIVDGVQSSLQNVNVSDIQSMQVLKDAGAAAIYGVRGSNGVIVITTKKGKSGAPTISYDGYFGYEVPPTGNVYDLANAKDYAAFVYKMVPTTPLFPGGVLPDYLYHGPGVSGIGNEGAAAVDPSKYVFDPVNRDDYLIQKVNKEGTDWFNEVFKPAPTQSHTLTMSGGTDKSNYLLALGYYDQTGTMTGTYLKRYSVRVNTEYKIHDKIRIGENTYMFYRSNPPIVRNTVHGNPLYHIHYMPTYIPVYDIEGNYGGNWIGPMDNGTKVNPVALAKDNDWKNATWDIIGNIYAEADFLKYITARTSFGGTIDNQYTTYFQPNQYYNQEQHYSNNIYQESALYNLNWVWTNTINYAQKFGLHNVKVLLGAEAIKNKGRAVGGKSEVFALTNPNYLILGNGTTGITNYSSAYNNAMFSLFTRFDYNYSERYLLGLTLRRDGSSKFGSNNRYGLFPSVSLGWRLSDETFMKEMGWLNDLKIRGSWGKLGSQNNLTDNNAYTLYNSGYGTSYYGITGTGMSTSQGFYQSNLGNSYTGWEEDIVTNIGFDASILNNKISISAEWFKKGINGLLFSEPLPATVGGATSPVINIGNIENKGLDLSVTYRNSITKDFNYEVGLIFSHYKNMVTDIPDPGYFDSGMSRNQEGHPVSAFFGYDVIGFFKDATDVSSSPTQTAAAPGRFKYRDVNGDNKITADDRTFFGDPNPDFTYGINLNTNYKNIDFAMILYGSQGNDVYQPKNITWNNYPQSLHNDLVLHSWTPENQENAKAPIAENSSNFSQNAGSFLVEDGSFLKCRSVLLGYSLTPAVLERIGISKFRIYFQIANLFTITKYTGLDPEIGGSTANFGVDGTTYPNNIRAYNLGVSLAF